MTTHNTPDYERYVKDLLTLLHVTRRAAAAELVCAITCEFVMPVPGVIDGAALKKAEREALAGDYCYESSQGDVDNLLKPIADAMQKAGWLLNDEQLAGKFGIKRYCREGEPPGTYLTILARTESPVKRWLKKLNTLFT